jgi:hypothetical protein
VVNPVNRSWLSRYLLRAVVRALLGCASLQTPVVIDDTRVRERAVSAMLENVRVSAAVLSAEDNRDFFGTDLNGSGVQTVWVEISNHSPHSLRLLRSGTDPDYFSPLEVAWSYHGLFSGNANSKIDDHFDELSIDGLIPSGETRNGMLYVNPHQRAQILNIDLLGQKTIIPFTLFLPVPDEQGDSSFDDLVEFIADSQHHNYRDEMAFRQALEQLPAMTTEIEGANERGGPINLVIIGKLVDAAAALLHRGYRHALLPADEVQRVFGRPPDLVVRKAGQGGVPANWMRLWVAPLRYQDQPVFIGQAGRPVGGRFMAADAVPRLHPDVDEARAYVIQDLLYAGGLAKLGFVGGVNAVSAEQYRIHPDELNYHSDGLRAVLFFVTRPLSLADVEILDWVPALEVQAAEAARRNAHQNGD